MLTFYFEWSKSLKNHLEDILGDIQVLGRLSGYTLNLDKCKALLLKVSSKPNLNLLNTPDVVHLFYDLPSSGNHQST